MLLVLLVLAPAPAQPYGTDLIASHSSGKVFRVTPAGKVTTIGDYGPGFLWDINWDIDNRHILAAVMSSVSNPAGYVLRIDPVSGVATTVIPSAAGPIIVKLDQNGDYLLSNGSTAFTISVMRVKRNTTNLVTILTGFQFRPAFHQERSTGDWLVASSMNQLQRYSSDWSQVTATIPHSFGYTFDMIQDPHHADVYVGASQCYRVDPRSNTMSSIFTRLGSTIGSRGLAVDRFPGAHGGMLYVTGSQLTPPIARIFKYDRSGRQLATIATFPSWVTGLLLDRERNLGTVLDRPPNDRRVLLSFPNDGGCPYALVFSLTGYTPGLALPDGRVIPLRFDTLTSVTAGGPVPPVLTGNHGILSAGGEAAARLDLNAFGGALRGVRLWAVAMTLDPKMTLGIRTISKPILLVLE
jgi:hypothetical protein